MFERSAIAERSLFLLKSNKANFLPTNEQYNTQIPTLFGPAITPVLSQKLRFRWQTIKLGNDTLPLWPMTFI